MTSNQTGTMRQIRFDTLGSAISAVEDWSINVAVTSDPDGTFMFFGHGENVATWICGDREDDLTLIPTGEPMH